MRSRLRPGPVHPRACGEQWKVPVFRDLGFGSSPRLRGTEAVLAWVPSKTRFIPAPAGNRLSLERPTTTTSVHPRACGEQDIGVSVKADRFGSSPRLRGTVPFAIGASEKRRFIPAPAGNSEYAGGSVTVTSVHPRACGEQRPVDSLPQSIAGSSPRLRGTGPDLLQLSLKGRFIPAPAGNRHLLTYIGICHTVHPPRLRGTTAR